MQLLIKYDDLLTQVLCCPACLHHVVRVLLSSSSVFLTLRVSFRLCWLFTAVRLQFPHTYFSAYCLFPSPSLQRVDADWLLVAERPVKGYEPSKSVVAQPGTGRTTIVRKTVGECQATPGRSRSNSCIPCRASSPTPFPVLSLFRRTHAGGSTAISNATAHTGFAYGPMPAEHCQPSIAACARTYIHSTHIHSTHIRAHIEV